MADTPDDVFLAGGSAGEMLRAARERHGLSVEEVADALNLRTGMIEALEDDNYAALPPRTFVKGYLRSYAKLVDLNDYDVLAAFERQQPESEDSSPPPTAAASRRPVAGGLIWLLAAIIVVLLGYGTYRLLLPQAEPSSDQAASAEAAAEQRAESATPVAEPPADDESTRQNAADMTGATGAADQEPIVDEAPVATQPPTEAETTSPIVAAPPLDSTPDTMPEAPVQAALVLEIGGESWVEVEDATGAIPLSALIQGPRTIDIDGEAPFRLTIGNAEAVQVHYTGELVSLVPHTRRNGVARLTVP